ncbi:MAG: hypothetical protein HQM16_18780, partial [Deltaproteobacteria bacterium]|nr:hypothetical protein [Deltaproteobacteria bacterium]
GTRENRADDGIDHADLNLPANHRKRRDKIESERSHLDVARALEENYDLEVQLGDTSGNSVDWSSNYAWLLLSETMDSYGREIESVEELEKFYAGANADLSEIKFRGYPDKPFQGSWSTDKGFEVNLKVDDDVAKLSESDVERLYRERRPEMTDLFTGQNEEERELSGFSGIGAEIVKRVRVHLARFSEAELSTRRKIELAIQAFPFPCLERDTLLLELVDSAPAGFLENWDNVRLVTNNFLTQRRVEIVGGRAFDAWLDGQSTGSLSAIGVDGVIRIVTTVYPVKSLVRDEAINRLMNGTADQRLDWVESFEAYQKLDELKSKPRVEKREEMGIPTDLTDGMFLADWVEGLDRKSKWELFFWLTGKRDLPPVKMMRSSIGKTREHFDTMKEMITESSSGVFIAHMTALFAGADGLLTSEGATPTDSPEVFLKELLDKLGLQDKLPEDWQKFFVSYFLTKKSYEAATILSTVLYKLQEKGESASKDDVLTIFISACGFEAIKLAQVAGQQSDLIADEELRGRLSEFQSLPEAGLREEAMVFLESWAKEKGIPLENIRLGRLIARASAGQVFELVITQSDGTQKKYAAKFILQGNRYGLEQKIQDLEDTISAYRDSVGGTFDVPKYLFDTLRRESGMELSLEQEARSLTRMKGSIESRRGGRVTMRVPDVETELSSGGIMLMENVDNSVTLKDLIAYDSRRGEGKAGADPELEPLRRHIPAILSESGTQWKKQVGWEGFYHGDLHPGNILVKKTLETGRPDIFWIDAANSKEINTKVMLRNVAALKAIGSDAGDAHPVVARMMSAGLAYLYTDIPPEIITDALHTAWSTYDPKAGASSLISAYQAFVLRIAGHNGSGKVVADDLALMTSILKASEILSDTGPAVAQK